MEESLEKMLRNYISYSLSKLEEAMPFLQEHRSTLLGYFKSKEIQIFLVQYPKSLKILIYGHLINNSVMLHTLINKLKQDINVHVSHLVTDDMLHKLHLLDNFLEDPELSTFSQKVIKSLVVELLIELHMSEIHAGLNLFLELLPYLAHLEGDELSVFRLNSLFAIKQLLQKVLLYRCIPQILSSVIWNMWEHHPNLCRDNVIDTLTLESAVLELNKEAALWGKKIFSDPQEFIIHAPSKFAMLEDMIATIVTSPLFTVVGQIYDVKPTKTEKMPPIMDAVGGLNLTKGIGSFLKNLNPFGNKAKDADVEGRLSNLYMESSVKLNGGKQVLLPGTPDDSRYRLLSDQPSISYDKALDEIVAQNSIAHHDLTKRMSLLDTREQMLAERERRIDAKYKVMGNVKNVKLGEALDATRAAAIRRNVDAAASTSSGPAILGLGPYRMSNLVTLELLHALKLMASNNSAPRVYMPR